MTTSQFVRQLRRLCEAGQLRFSLQPGERVWGPAGRFVRLQLIRSKAGRCPIAAVARKLVTGNYDTWWDWGAAIGLAPASRVEIFRAADLMRSTGVTPGADPQLRAALLEACHLVEGTEVPEGPEYRDKIGPLVCE